MWQHYGLNIGFLAGMLYVNTNQSAVFIEIQHDTVSHLVRIDGRPFGQMNI